MGRDEYSLRAGIEAGEQGLHIVVMGEIPMAEVIMGLGKLASGKPPTLAHQKAYTRARLDELAAGQSLRIDGKEVAATWAPTRSALNGRAVDGFFVYVVEARVPMSDLDDDVEVVLVDKAWEDRPMVYSNQARVRGPWSVASTNATPEWTSDAGNREVRARFVRTP